jgi:transcription antitermination protein NusB
MATYKRRIIREKVLQALYAYEISKEPIAGVITNVFGDLKSSKDDFDFARRLVTEVIHHEVDVERMIRDKVAHWEYDRIALIDKILIRMGICELLFFPDIPPKVTLNETIEVGKAYSTEQSGKFINGILDAILEDLKSKNQMHKTGRGLIDENLHNGTRTPPPIRKPSRGS